MFIFMQLSLHLWLAIFVSLPPSAVAQTPSYSNTSQTLCNGTFADDTAYHIQEEHTTNLFLPVVLSSCQNGDSTMSIYWFWYDDVCRNNATRFLPFAIVGTDGTLNCIDSSRINITQASCENDYNFTRQAMTIKNITKPTPQKYICFLSTTAAAMNYTSTRIYSINVLEPTTLPSTFSSTLAPINSTTEGNLGNSTTTPGDPGTSPLLTIVLPVVLSVVVIIIIIIVGLLFYRRRRRRRQVGKKSAKYELEQTPSRVNQSSIGQRQAIYGEDISTLESDHGYPVWRPVQQKT